MISFADHILIDGVGNGPTPNPVTVELSNWDDCVADAQSMWMFDRAVHHRLIEIKISHNHK